MATVNVANWAEFVEAVAVAGDTVVLPNGDRWDMNVIAPEGVSGDITVACEKIVGNGTMIMNGHFYGSFQVSGTEIDDLHVISFLADRLIQNSSTPTYNRCMFSGLISGGGRVIATGDATWNRCAVNVESQSTNASTSGSDVFTGTIQYCRIIYHAANIGIIRFAGFSNSEFVFYCPQCTKIYVEQLVNCTIRGNLPLCTYVGYYSYKYGSSTNIVNTSDLAEGAQLRFTALVGVTDEQMKDASYLDSLGFPIGGEEE